MQLGGFSELLHIYRAIIYAATLAFIWVHVSGRLMNVCINSLIAPVSPLIFLRKYPSLQLPKAPLHDYRLCLAFGAGQVSPSGFSEPTTVPCCCCE